QQRSQINTRPPNDDGQPLATGDVGNRRSRLPCILPCGEWLAGFRDIEEMMRRQRPLLRGWLGRTNLELTIDGYRIATDHFTCELLRQSNRKRRFARTCGSKDDDQKWFRLRRSRSSHSTRTPGDGPAKTEECQGKNEDHHDEQAENLGALTRTIARFPICIMLASIGVRRLYRLLARDHSPILLVPVSPYRPFAGCSRNENARPDRGRDIPTARERTDSTRCFPPRRRDRATRRPRLR